MNPAKPNPRNPIARVVRWIRPKVVPNKKRKLLERAAIETKDGDN